MDLLKYNISDNVIAFSTKRGGGEGSYEKFNITHYCGDSAEHVSACRKELCEELNIKDDNLILPRQTHETNIIDIDEEFLSLNKTEQIQKLYGVDAIITSVSSVCIGVSTADCIPLLLYDANNKAVAAIHAGWRGTVQRIVEKTIGYMQNAFSTSPNNIVAVIGPSIGVEAFEVGDEVYEAFSQQGFNMNIIAKRYKKWHIDLWEANRIQLINCGVIPENIQLSSICTYTNHNEFFSARRLGINSGRIFNGIMIK
ncbi:MAG: peptidoglycan editing factor PgeF [Muribaculaceae bacterium]|nr:peptidoglycan editing factor PgeF [Muribaculaceae bacterium]